MEPIHSEKTEVLLDRSRIERILMRMAHQIAEITTGDALILLGLNERGLALARGIQSEMQRFGLARTQLLSMQVDGNEGPGSLIAKPGGTLVVIDDVVFSGKTLFRALRSIPSLDAFDRVLTCTLVDRGHRRWPVLSTVTGLSMPTKTGEHIHVELAERDGAQRVERVLLEFES